MSSRRWLGNAIQRRVAIIATIITACALVVASLAIYLLSASSLYREFDVDLFARARAMSALVEHDAALGRLEVDLPAVGDVMDPTMGFQLWTADGRLLAGDQELISWETITQAIGSQSGAQRIIPWRLERLGTSRCLLMRSVSRTPTNATKSSSAPSNSLIAVVINPTTDIDDHLRRLAILLAIVTLTISTLSGLAITVILRREMRPLANLAEEIAGFDGTDLRTRLNATNRSDELAPVVTHLNGLLTRLESAMVRERRFSAAAAHELRTPLAGLRATLEVADMDPQARSTERSHLRICLGVTEQMQHLVDTLLMMTRIEAGQLTPRLQSVDLERLLDECWAEQAHLAAERHLIMTRTTTGCTFISDQQLLRLVIRNLISNAIAYTNDGGDISIASSHDETLTTITISNSGCQIANSDSERIFEPFWRGDAARTGTDQHCGLGLALCRDVSALLGGTITATINHGRRFTIVMKLPNATPNLSPIS